MGKPLIVFGIIILLLTGCNTADNTPTPTPEFISPTPHPSQTFTPAPTATFTPIPTETQIPTATVIPTPTWETAGPGEVTAPILMYHDVDPEKGIGKYSYNIHPETFAAQMQLLDDLGYHTITARELVAAIREGAPLPPNPIILTFDDGYLSVYQNAFPIMQQHEFVGVAYIVANRLEAEGFLNATELEEMITAGWEIGSHSYTHSDLTIDHSTAYNEIVHSKERISEATGVEVDTFAYPFGAIDYYLGDRTRKWGYSGAMGLGWKITHSEASLFYLQRIEIFGEMSLEEFQEALSGR
jgi:peptidoglycan/xylan/chitin deacetylase (PgdA/CDA1 family)